MQLFINYAIEFVISAFIAHMAIHFIAGLPVRSRKPASQPKPIDRPIASTATEAHHKPEYWQQKLNTLEQLPEQPEQPIVEPIKVQPAQYAEPVIVPVACPLPSRSVDVVVPFRRPARQTDWQALTPAQLRKECQKRGIRWRDVYGKNKHLKKSEMVAALRRVQAA